MQAKFSPEALQSLLILLLVMPETLAPRILLALSAVDEGADSLRTHPTAIWADQLATTDFLNNCALDESWDLSSIWEKLIDLVQLLVSAS